MVRCNNPECTAWVTEGTSRKRYCCRRCQVRARYLRDSTLLETVTARVDAETRRTMAVEARAGGVTIDALATEILQTWAEEVA